jgi:tetratricopeptide (TPR) repeat protein
MRTWGVVLLAAAVTIGVAAQQGLERSRARSDYLRGWELMRIEAWADAGRAFQTAIDIDAEFEDAYYGLGRSWMQQKQFERAIVAYLKCRDLYRAEVGRRFTNQQEAQRYRRDRLMELDEILRQSQQGPQTNQTQQRQRQVQEQRRQVAEIMDRGANISIEPDFPAFVSLALGSAYFRSGKFADAEREYKAAIASDPKTGEAHNNLAVVYLQTERFADADREVSEAEKAGFKVHPRLKQDIKNGLKN